MFRLTDESSVAAWAAPKLPCGSYGGWSVLIAQLPQASPVTVVVASHS